MKTVEEFPKLTKVQIVPGDNGHYLLKDAVSGDTLNKSFDSMKDALSYAIGAFLVPVNSI